MVDKTDVSVCELNNYSYLFNFMIEKLTFLQHQFDESITKYGHEDTLFGKALQADRIPIIHIDNPLLNKGLDTNDRKSKTFCRRTGYVKRT